MMFSTFLFAGVPLILIAVLYCAIPVWRRDRLFFGVTAAPDFRDSEEGSGIARRYRWSVAVVTLFAVVFSIVAIACLKTWLFVVAPLLQSFGAGIAFAVAHRRARAHALPNSTVRTASLHVGTEQSPGGWVTMVAPLLLLAGTALYAQWNWGLIPERIPTHWDLAGRVNGWNSRTEWGVYGLLAVAALISGLVVAGALLIRFGTRRGGDDESRAWHAQFRGATEQLLIAVEWVVCCSFSWLVAGPILARQTGVAVPTWPMPVLVLVILGYYTWPLIRLSSQPGSGNDQTPDDCWKWGMIYYNPNDPALMVERRFGIGYTLNMANRMSWVLTAGLVAVTIGIIFLAKPMR